MANEKFQSIKMFGVVRYNTTSTSATMGMIARIKIMRKGVKSQDSYFLILMKSVPY